MQKKAIEKARRAALARERARVSNSNKRPKEDGEKGSLDSGRYCWPPKASTNYINPKKYFDGFLVCMTPMDVAKFLCSKLNIWSLHC